MQEANIENQFIAHSAGRKAKGEHFDCAQSKHFMTHLRSMAMPSLATSKFTR
jgi:hypothetical protein